MLLDDIETMQRHEAFVRITDEIRNMRDDCIQEMRGAETHVLQQVAGKITAYDEVLALFSTKRSKNKVL